MDRKPTAITYLRILARGWILVSLVAANTVHLASGHTSFAAIGGFAISALWWSNSSKDREQAKGAALVYGCGAALGTLTGATIARLITW